MALWNSKCITNFHFLTQSLAKGHRNVTTSSIDYFRVTSHMWAEPLKKKKRIDPAIVKAREDRKKRKLEKEIRRLEKNVLQVKPLEEMEVSSALKKSFDTRKREEPKLSEEEEDRRFKISKQWCQFKYQQHHKDFDMINKVLKTTEKTLQELRRESEDLYQEAIQVDLKLLPFRCKGPVFTPAIEGFVTIDGDFKDITKKWE